MIYEVFEDKKHPGDWRVEATDTDGNYDRGACFVTIFCGSLSEERSKEYAAFKNVEKLTLTSTISAQL